jgi:DNA polymerase-3 subunit gamma/tau
MADGYQSLYRRYRSKRFDELKGQDHVVRALKTAVSEDRVGHAYLFSGPRGTGKTSTARILAKVLNCEKPKGGEPCGVCPNCEAVDRGLIVDWLLELDAASNNGVANIRELIERIPLGTSGNRKVVILDEVHMLSTGAANALLKSLEEPPSHVVFILATTDPQKVLPTIRMTVASTNTAVARPRPIIFTVGSSTSTKLRKTQIMISAAEVMTRAVAASPAGTLSRALPDRSHSSRTRESRNTS